MDACENVDMELRDILDSWNLGHLYEHFREQNISVEVMKILETKHIERLFEKYSLGDQALFEDNLEKWKQEILFGQHSHITHFNRPSKSTHIQSSLVPPPISGNTNIQLSTANKTLSNLNEVSKSLTVQPFLSTLPTQTFNTSSTLSSTTFPPRSMPFAKRAPYNVRKILEESSRGREVLSDYEKNKVFKEKDRRVLIDVIARYVIDAGRKLPPSERRELEYQIVELFPTEKEEFYRNNTGGRIYGRYERLKKGVCS